MKRTIITTVEATNITDTDASAEEFRETYESCTREALQKIGVGTDYIRVHVRVLDYEERGATRDQSLKSCPFCGGEASLCATPWDFENKRPKPDAKYVVACGECFAQTDEYEDSDEAIEAWQWRRTGDHI